MLKSKTNLTKKQLLLILQHKTKTSKQLSAWCNLLKEWYLGNFNREKVTYIYYSKCKNKPNNYKIGISNNLVSRKTCFGENKYYDYKIIKEFDNRYICAFVEYKIRLKYCLSTTELIKKQDLNSVIDYVNKFKINSKSTKNEMKDLGYIDNN